MIITAASVWKRIGCDDERPADRKFITMISMGEWRRAWRKAEAEEDYDQLDHLDRIYERVNCL